jgi:hypothetical protein
LSEASLGKPVFKEPRDEDIRMKTFSSSLRRIAVASVVLLVVSCLPVIPVLRAPVIPDPVYEATMVSILQLLASLYLTGIQLRATWMTWPAFIGLTVVALIVIRYLNRRIFGWPRRG